MNVTNTTELRSDGLNFKTQPVKTGAQSCLLSLPNRCPKWQPTCKQNQNSRSSLNAFCLPLKSNKLVTITDIVSAIEFSIPWLRCGCFWARPSRRIIPVGMPSLDSMHGGSSTQNQKPTQTRRLTAKPAKEFPNLFLPEAKKTPVTFSVRHLFRSRGRQGGDRVTADHFILVAQQVD